MSNQNQTPEDKTNPLGVGLSSNPSEDGGTRVDLGEDLLESTRAVPLAAQTEEKTKEQSRSEPTLEEELANVEILINEKIYEDAKKILRKILRKNSNNTQAKNLLNQIQDREIQELLAGDQRAGPKFNVQNAESEQTLDEIMNKLDNDLRLGITKENQDHLKKLFPTSEEEETYNRKVLAYAEHLSVQDLIDLAVAHIEMGLYGTSIQLLEEVIKNEENSIRGMYLLGLALLGSEKYVEMTIRLEPLVRDLALPEDQKVDFLYLMGLAFEGLGEIIKAKDFFRRAYYLNPKYRDLSDKMR